MRPAFVGRQSRYFLDPFPPEGDADGHHGRQRLVPSGFGRLFGRACSPFGHFAGGEHDAPAQPHYDEGEQKEKSEGGPHADHGQPDALVDYKLVYESTP